MAAPPSLVNLAVSAVAGAPSPAISGTSLSVTAAQGARFPLPSSVGSFYALVWPTGAAPSPANAEIVLCTSRATDTLTITRAQGGTSARTIVIGDNIANITPKEFFDVLCALGGRAGGQILNGGTAASDDLTLVSTSHATKDRIYLGAAQTSAFDELNGRLGINVAAPAVPLHVVQPTVGNEVSRLVSTATNDDPTESKFQARAATTDATVTTLATITIPATTSVLITARVVARRTGGSAGTAEDGAGYVRSALVKNVAGTATLIGSVVDGGTFESQAGFDCTIDVTGGTARIRVTGVVNNNLTWHATYEVYAVSS